MTVGSQVRHRITGRRGTVMLRRTGLVEVLWWPKDGHGLTWLPSLMVRPLRWDE